MIILFLKSDRHINKNKNRHSIHSIHSIHSMHSRHSIHSMSNIIILTFDEFDKCADVLVRILECLAHQSCTSSTTSTLRDIIIGSFDTLHPQVADKLLEILSRYNWQHGQFTGPFDTNALVKEVDELYDSLNAI